MANRFWVAATATNWQSTSGWSTTNGGGSGASVPGPNDDVFFQQGSANCRSVDFEATCRNLTINGWTGKFSSNAPVGAAAMRLTGNLTVLGTSGGGFVDPFDTQGLSSFVVYFTGSNNNIITANSSNTLMCSVLVLDRANVHLNADMTIYSSNVYGFDIEENGRFHTGSFSLKNLSEDTPSYIQNFVTGNGSIFLGTGTHKFSNGFWVSGNSNVFFESSNTSIGHFITDFRFSSPSPPGPRRLVNLGNSSITFTDKDTISGPVPFDISQSTLHLSPPLTFLFGPNASIRFANDEISPAQTTIFVDGYSLPNTTISVRSFTKFANNMNIRSLTIEANSIVQFAANTTINVGSFFANGTAGNLINVYCDTDNQYVVFTKPTSSNVSVDYITLRGTQAIGNNWIARANSVNVNASNIGWVFLLKKFAKFFTVI